MRRHWKVGGPGEDGQGEARRGKVAAGGGAAVGHEGGGGRELEHRPRPDLVAGPELMFVGPGPHGTTWRQSPGDDAQRLRLWVEAPRRAVACAAKPKEEKRASQQGT